MARDKVKEEQINRKTLTHGDLEFSASVASKKKHKLHVLTVSVIGRMLTVHG